jgi:hypothetical protein
VGAIADERATIAGKLTAAGMTITLDPGAVAPFVLVGQPVGVSASGVGAWQITYPIIVASTPPGDAASLAWRLEQVETIVLTLGWAPFAPGIYGPKDLPAYTLTYPRTVTNPNC